MNACKEREGSEVPVAPPFIPIFRQALRIPRTCENVDVLVKKCQNNVSLQLRMNTRSLEG